MKIRDLALISLFSLSLQSTAFGETVNSKVNYHLRKMQTTVDAKESKARLEHLKAGQIKIERQNELLRNDPSFGFGDEAYSQQIAEEEDHMEPSYQYQPVLTAEEKIRLELEQRKMTNYESGSKQNLNADETAEFIREFKENAAAQGVHLEVDPKTMRVYRAR